MCHRISLLLSLIALGAGLAWPLATGVARPESRASAAGPQAGAASSVAASGALRAPHLRTGARGVPLAFEANRGQFNPAAQYRARGDGFAIYLARDGVHFEPRATRRATGRAPPADSVSLQIEGAPNDLEWRGRDALAATANYFLGADRARWRTNVPLYASAGALHAGPGVDWLVYAGANADTTNGASANGVEMDFDLAPGTDPRHVRLEARGAKSLKINREGDLLLATRTAEIRLHSPAIYQMIAGRPVVIEGGYALVSSHEVSFRVGTYDPKLPLVIDPSVAITYTTFLGGSGSDLANGLALDLSGAVYIGGTTTSASTFSESATSKFGPGGGPSDFFVAKIDPTQSGAASLLYLTFIGGSGDEEGGKLAVNSSGNVAIVGTTNSTDYPTTDSSKMTKGTDDLALTVLDSAGSSLVFSTVLDGTGAFAASLDAAGDHGTPAVAFAPSGAVMVAADTSAPDLPVTAGAFQTTYGGTAQTSPPAPQSDGILAVYTGSELTYLTYFGINGYTGVDGNFVPATVGVTGIAIDLLGQAYVTGFTSQPGTGFPVTNGFQTTYGGGAFDAFLMCFSPKGLGTSDLIYSTFLGGTASDQAFSVAVDQAIPANAYVAGTTSSSGGLTSITPVIIGYQSALQGSANAFLATVSQTAAGVTTLNYATYLGGGQTDSALAVSALGADAVYLTGHAQSANFPTLNSLQSFSGTGDAFLTKLDTTAAGAASLLYATLLGGGSDSQGNGVAALPTGEVVVAGSTSSQDFPLAGNTGTGVQPICASCQESPALPDAFVVAFAESAATGPVVSFNAPQLNFGNVPDGSPNPPQVGILTNAGTAALSISSIAITGANASDFAQSNTCPITPSTLAPQATCQITANFSPTSAGAETAAVSFTDNAVGSPQSIDLAGTGQEPLASLSTAVVNFGSQPAGTASNQQTITLTNGGNLQLAISEVNITGPDVAQFRFSGANTCVNPPVVAPGGSCIMNVQFAPQTMGTFNADIVLTDNAGNASPATQIVQLSGIGSAAAPTANVAPPALNFGSQGVGSTSGTQSVSVSNTGSLPLQVGSISMNGPNAGEFKIMSGTTCPVNGGSVGIAGLCGLNVAFAPATTGTKSAAISFVDNAANSPQIVTLSGSGINAPLVTVSSSSIGFQAQTLQVASGASNITITNAGTTAIQIFSIAIVGPNAGDFSEGNNCPGTLNPPSGSGQSSCQIAVKFEPTAGGARTATLSITDNAAGSPQLVNLSGTGLVPAITLSAATVNFPAQLAGTASAPTVVTLTNSASGAQAGGLVISATPLSGSNAAEFSATPNCGAMLAPGNSCGISIVFQPQPGQSGAAVATISVTDNAPGSPQAIALTGSAEDFSLGTSTSGSLSAVVSPGATAQYNLQINSLNGFAGSLSLTCAGAPSAATCTPAPSTVAVPGTGATPFTVSVATQLATSRSPGENRRPPARRRHLQPPSPGLLCLATVVLLASLLCAGAFGRRRTWKRLAIASVYAFGLFTALAMSSCGGSGSGSQPTASQPGTPAGTYTLTVTASFTPTGVTTPVTRTLTLTLAVQ